MQATTRAVIVLLLITQGVYDLALGGWGWLLQASQVDPTNRQQLHALYCRCTHCPDISRCCCVPTQQVGEQSVLRQCDPADEGKLPNTWYCRVVSTAPLDIPLLVAEEVLPASASLFLLLPARIEHPPRA